MRDIETEADIAFLIDGFYDKVLLDKTLKPIFVDVAKIDLEQHKGFIRQYWEKLLLKKPGYDRHTMNIHRALAAESKRQALPIESQHFDRWLALFVENLGECFSGQLASKAEQIARHIAANMQRDMVESAT